MGTIDSDIYKGLPREEATHSFIHSFKKRKMILPKLTDLFIHTLKKYIYIKLIPRARS